MKKSSKDNLYFSVGNLRHMYMLLKGQHVKNPTGYVIRTLEHEIKRIENILKEEESCK